MGNDGGVVAVKRKFMRHANQKTKSEKVDQEVARLERATTCAISGDALQEPIVACELGNLYNKQALLEHLLAKTVPERFQHITSLKDVTTCRFSKQSDSASASSKSFCPVTMLEFNGKQPFVMVWTCGCVLSERAMKEVQTKECLSCGKAIEGAKIVALLQSEEQYTEGQKKLLERKAQEKRQKKDSKKKSDKKRHERTDEAAVDDQGEQADAQPAKKRKEKKEKADKPPVAPTGALASIAQEATAAIEQAKAKNKVFASLFDSGKANKQQSANDLLMTVGGMRYSLS